MERPNKVNVLGVEYDILYKDNPAEVDIYKRESFWGQVDHWTKTIRVYDGENNGKEILDTLIHEILHVIDKSLNLKAFKGDEGHNELGMIAMALADTFIRNGWIKPEGFS